MAFLFASSLAWFVSSSSRSSPFGSRLSVRSAGQAKSRRERPPLPFSPRAPRCFCTRWSAVPRIDVRRFQHPILSGANTSVFLDLETGFSAHGGKEINGKEEGGGAKCADWLKSGATYFFCSDIESYILFFDNGKRNVHIWKPVNRNHLTRTS